MRLPPLPPVKDILKLYNVTALKQLSQNFLLDLKVTDRIAHGCGNLSNKVVLEIGPGLGSLTRSVLNADAGLVVAIEKDLRMKAPLAMLEQASEGKLRVVFGDALEVDHGSLISEQVNFPQDVKMDWEAESPVVVVGNLPFGVATPLLIRWLRAVSKRESVFQFGRTSMALMFQKEFGDRIVAPVGTSEYGRLSVMAQNYCAVRRMFDVPGGMFTPRPKVDGTMVHFTPLVKPLYPINVDILEGVCSLLFSYRRKSLKHVLRHALELSEREADSLLHSVGLPPTVRAQELEVPRLGKLADLYGNQLRPNFLNKDFDSKREQIKQAAREEEKNAPQQQQKPQQDRRPSPQAFSARFENRVESEPNRERNIRRNKNAPPPPFDFDADQASSFFKSGPGKLDDAFLSKVRSRR